MARHAAPARGARKWAFAIGLAAADAPTRRRDQSDRFSRRLSDGGKWGKIQVRSAPQNRAKKRQKKHPKKGVLPYLDTLGLSQAGEIRVN